VKLFYRKLGEGKPLIILHGLFGLSDNWVTLGRTLAEHYNVMLVDLRNHGQSPHSSQFSYDAMSGDLSELFEELNIPQAILIGHSLGGKLAMQFALDNPEKVEKLIIVDIAPKPTPLKHLEIIKAMLEADFDKLRSRKAVEDFLGETIKSRDVRQLLMKNLYWVDKTRLAWKLNIVAINENIDEIFKGISADIPFIKPVLFIKGSLSAYIQEDDLLLIKELFPAYKLEVIEAAGHWVHSDAPAAFLEKLNDFLNFAQHP
jgi:esterase